MKRITVSLPDELVDRIRRAAGGEGMVSSYVATALADYEERETLDELVASWQSETPVPEDVHRQAVADLDGIGLAAGMSDGREAG
jgi:predicted transcriptional regulator